MKLTDFKKAIDHAYKKAGGAKGSAVVEFWLGNKLEDQLLLESISQFGIVPDVVITLKRPKKVK